MLVKELIAKLNEQDPEAQVIITDRNGYFNEYIGDTIFTDTELVDHPIVPLFCGPHDFLIEPNENSDNN